MRMKLMFVTGFRAAAAAALVLHASSGSAAPSADPAPDHGKMATEEATPVGLRAIEVEASYSPTLLHRGSGSFDRSGSGYAHAASLAVFYGLTEHLDVKVAGGLEYAVDDAAGPGPTRGSGPSDLVVGTRWRFVTARPRTC